MRNLVLAGVFLLSLSQFAQAALFDDKEARQQIQDMQKKMDSQNQATQDAIKKNQQALEQRIAALEAVIKGQGLMDLLGQVERLNQELSNVKGQLEVANHNIEGAQQRQKDLYADVDGRVRKLDSGAPVSAAVTDAPAATSTTVADNAGEAKDFETVQSLSRSGKHKEAFEAFDKFLQTYPNSTRAADAQYALGYAQFSLKNYKAAIATQQKLLKQFPDSQKAADASFNIANSQIQLADIDGAKKTLRELLAKYPNSEVAPNAKRRLTVLDSIKK
ncbi:MAG: tol-pal system protein YbgF [Methylophilaceae bacterium]